MERSFIIVKPDAIQRGLSGEILHRFEKKGLKIIGLKMMHLDKLLLREHYAHVVEKPFFEELSEFMSSIPVIVLALEGIDAVNVVRTISGTSPSDLGSIRGDYCSSGQKNVIHSSDSPKNAQDEIKRFFKKDELFEYDKDEWKHIFAESDKKES